MLPIATTLCTESGEAVIRQVIERIALHVAVIAVIGAIAFLMIDFMLRCEKGRIQKAANDESKVEKGATP